MLRSPVWSTSDDALTLFDAAALGPATSQELATRAGLHERYVREWLGAMATAGVFEYEASTSTYWLPSEHAVSLTGRGPENIAGIALLTTILAKHVPSVADAFRHGGGVPYEAYAPEIHDALDALWGPIFTDLLVPDYLPLAPGLTEKLTGGARAADVGCGTGTALVTLAAAFPESSFVGYDVDGAGLTRARHLVLYEPGLGFSCPDEAIEAVETAIVAGDREGALLAALAGIFELTEDEIAFVRSSPAWPARLAAVPVLPREIRAETGWFNEPGQFDAITAPSLLLAGSDSPPAQQEATRSGEPNGRWCRRLCI